MVLSLTFPELGILHLFKFSLLSLGKILGYIYNSWIFITNSIPRYFILRLLLQMEFLLYLIIYFSGL
jgi:hypothetical protein